MAKPNLIEKAKQTLQRPLSSYVDYRAYLFDLYELRKSLQSPFSYLHFAQELGFSPTNVIRLVIAGKRSLAPKSAQKIAKSLKFTPIDRRYFLTLVGYNDAKSPKLKKQKFNELLAIKQECLSEEDGRGLVDYFSHWSRPVIREVLRIMTLPGSTDPRVVEKAAAQLREVLYPDLRVPKAQEALDFLLENRYLTHGDGGEIVNQDAAPMVMPMDVAAGKLSALSYHQQMLLVAQECLIKVPESQREFNSLTLCLSETVFNKLKEEIRGFCEKALNMESQVKASGGRENTKPDRVVQLNIQLFTLTKP